MANVIMNNIRDESLYNNKMGPKILILGSSASGKTTICHIFLNYAIKFGWTPIYIDLDLSNEIAVPGSISATVVDMTVPVFTILFRMTI